MGSIKDLAFVWGMISSAFLVSGCAPVVIGGGALVESAIAEERGFGMTVSDAEIRAKIHTRVMKYSFKVFNHLNFKVREGKVLITGSTDTSEEQLEVVRLVWDVKGVREVVNEIQVGQKGTVGDYARDAWITTQLKTQMLFTKDIPSRNYSIDTVGAVVYLMGIAQSQDELNRVTDLASRINDVRKVISYVRVKDPQKGLIDAAPPPESLGAPIVQAPPHAEVHVEPLPPSEGVVAPSPAPGAPRPMTPSNF